MTTIAWDGKTLASDSCSWSGGVRRKVKKCFVVEREGRKILVAFSGSGSYCTQVLKWMTGESDRPNPSDYFDKENISGQCAVVIDDELKVWALGNDLVYMEMCEEKFAYGAGQDIAWGALEAGASSIMAIEISIKRSDYAGIGIDYVSFE